jgi:hypothetical protein
MVRRIKGAWLGTGVRSIHRAEKFLVLRGRYELLVQSQGRTIAPPIAAVFARVPPMVSGTTADAYLVQVKDAVTWSDVDVLEEAVIAIWPVTDLPEQLNLQRLVYSQTVTADEYERYQKTMLDVNTAPSQFGQHASERIRSELLAVTQRIKYMLEYGPPREEARARLTTRVILTMIGGIVLVFIAYIVSQIIVARHGDTFVPPEAVFVVLWAGLVGGFISVQQRLQEPTEIDPLYKWLELDASGKSLLLSPLIGMIFAVVLFVILTGEFVKGPLFPTFLGCAKLAGPVAATHCASSDFASFTLASTPDSPTSWAKLTIWAFAAGFLERLVPDILTRIAAVAEKS